MYKKIGEIVLKLKLLARIKFYGEPKVSCFVTAYFSYTDR